MLAFAIVAMFLASLMIGRLPAYLGKTLEAREIKMTMLALLSYSLSILAGTALAASVPQGLASTSNPGPHGFTEILYAYASATGNNGSSFAGLSTNTLFYNTTLAAAMLIGRFLLVIPLLAVAGSLARKKAHCAVDRVLADAQPAIRWVIGRSGADLWQSKLLSSPIAGASERTLRDDRRGLSMLRPEPRPMRTYMTR